MRRVSTLVAVLLLTGVACGGGTGAQGPAGEPGPQGSAGPEGPAVVTANSDEPPGANCTWGGFKVQFGPDTDGDQVLDPGEVDASLTQYLCNGAPGVECWDSNQNHACDVATEDKNADGACDLDDCRTPPGGDFIENQSASAQAASFRVDGTGTTGGLLRSNYGLRVEDSVLSDNGADHPLLVLRSGWASPSTPVGDRFVVDEAGGFVANGALGVGDIPASGAGVRLMWHPYKAAFRAGVVGASGSVGTQWDDANVGFFSWAGGYNTTAAGLATFAMGYESSAEGAHAIAIGSNANAPGGAAVAIGSDVTADANFSIAIGQHASANGHVGAMVLGDDSTTTDLLASADNEFGLRAAGGVRIFTNAAMTSGVYLVPGSGTWQITSDRNAKTDFRPLDADQVLRKVTRLPMQSWAYKTEAGKPRHVGPMAQDFHAAFGLGSSDTSITEVDLAGINMTAIQALAAENQRLKQQLADTNARLERLERALAK